MDGDDGFVELRRRREGTDRIVAFTVVGRVIIGTVIRKHGVATLALHAGT